MLLNERKISVLHAIIDDYIRSAEPVGSRTIARRYNLGVSPATIRNEMADLEETGYIIQPHISAGRIPSDKGYRFYVDVLMEPSPIPAIKRQEIYRRVQKQSQEIEVLIQETSKLLALLTNYVAIVVVPPVVKCVLKHIQLVLIDELRILVILVLYPGIVQNRIIRVQTRYTVEDLTLISQQLTQKLQGLSYGEMRSGLIKDIKREFGDIGSAILDIIHNELADSKQEQYYLNGAIQIFEQPEFRDIERAKGLLSLLEKGEAVSDLLGDWSKINGVKVIIGQENPRAEIHECSVVTSNYSIGQEVIGTIGVIGPTRMEYARVYSIVELIADSLSEILTEIVK